MTQGIQDRVPCSGGLSKEYRDLCGGWCHPSQVTVVPGGGKDGVGHPGDDEEADGDGGNLGELDVLLTLLLCLGTIRSHLFSFGSHLLSL